MSQSTERLSSALADRYKIIRHLGEGGMATVYLAEDLKHERQVAVKVLRPELAAVLGAERFVQEIKTTANLQHPHILPLFDSGTAGGEGEGAPQPFLYYVMPFIDGETLRDKLDRETQLGIDEAVKITVEIADALDYAHRHGIIHRDIKPENILLHDGRPMVADFGIALAVSVAAGGRMTETGLSLGTPHYMSPEQATAEKDLTARSDIYSLGSMLYEMLTGDPPHTGSTAQQIIMKIVTDEARSVTDLRKTVPPNVAAATAKALEKLPADRFESAAAFGEALGASDFAVANAGVSRATASTRHGSGTDLVKVGLAALSASLALLLIWSWFFNVPTPPGVIRVVTKPAARSEIFRQFGTTIALSPDGRSMIRSGAGSSGEGKLWLRRWDRLGEEELRGVDGAYSPMYSPDGQSVGFLSRLNHLAVFSLVNGTQTTVLDSGLSDTSVRGGGIDWGQDGFIYAAGLSGLIRVDPENGDSEQLTVFDSDRGEVTHAWVNALPNGRGALLTLIPENVADLQAHVVAVANFETGEIAEIYQAVFARYLHSGHVLFVLPDGSLFAARFNQDRLALESEALPLPDTVEVGSLGAAELAVSESGRVAYVKTREATGQLVWVDRNGEAEPVGDWGREGLLDPALSPDGTKLAVSAFDTEGWHVWVRPLDGGTPVRISFSGVTNTRASWSPDGESLAFISDPDGPARAVVAASDGSGVPREVPLDDPREIFGISWSHDGSWLMLRTDNQAEGRGDIIAIRPFVDSTARVLVASPAEEISPFLSPDGSILAYVSDVTGRREVYVREFLSDPSTEGMRVSRDGGEEPLWSRNGRELFYRGATDSIISVQIAPGPRLGRRETLFSAHPFDPHQFHRNYDISLDDRRFLMFAGSEEEDELVVVFNLAEELRAMFDD